MKGINLRVFIFHTAFIAILSFSCSSKFSHGSGVVVSRTKPYNIQKSSFVEAPLDHPPIKILFKDSYVIVIVPERIIRRHDGVLILDSIGVHHYAFLNLKTRKCSEYLNFSDTAKLLSTKILPDSISVLGGLTLLTNSGIPQKTASTTLSDTSIDGVQYRRNRFESKQENGNYQWICYYRCDKKGVPISYFAGQGEKEGCPMTKYEIMINDKIGDVAMELDFISFTLTQEEIKVFNAWEKNQNTKQ